MIAWLASFLAVAALVGAWLQPSTPLCVALGWTSLPLFYVALAAPKRRVLRLYVAGVATYIGGFYWLLGTIKDFGGIPFAPALGIFLFYAVASAIQFLIWGFSFSHLPRWCERWGLRMAISWLIAFHCWIKIFPWDFGHTQLEFVPFAQLAGVLGVTGITFVMMWIVEVLCSRRTVSRLALPVALLVFGGALSYGTWVQERIARATPNSIATVMIQGNVTLQRRNGLTYYTINHKQYLETSSAVTSKDTLIIWPESTLPGTLPDSITHVSQTNALPFFGDGSTILAGGITSLDDRDFFNSSLLIRPDGSIDEPYHKNILIPFGEYIPFARWFPVLRQFNQNSGDFIAGSTWKVFSYTLSDGRMVKLSPLICYEDVVPYLAQRATAAGAELLVNQTNDVWFGNTVAPHQHHMIASFRAIENRRFLLRSTNTGLTAVVDPLGQTLAKLLPYTEATLPMEVALLNYQSTFTTVPITLIWLVIAAVGALFVVVGALRRPKN